jgi:hypothetical protein
MLFSLDADAASPGIPRTRTDTGATVILEQHGVYSTDSFTTTPSQRDNRV